MRRSHEVTEYLEQKGLVVFAAQKVVRHAIFQASAVFGTNALLLASQPGRMGS
jgi:hypothetical protein